MVSLRYEFVRLAEREGANIRELCRRFTISPPTAYKWLSRYAQEGAAGLADRSRRPRGSPRRTAAALEQAVLGIREEHPAWGGRTIRKVLLDRDGGPVPSPSTITAILRRHDRIAIAERAQRDWQRFEHPRPNDLWQMDFKGHFPTGVGRCHPLTIVDDHSRFAIGLQACADERTGTVQERLRDIFRVYGLPERLLMDNGSPWGSDAAHPAHPPHRLAPAPRHPGEPRAPVPSADPRQGGALPPDAEGRGAARQALRRPPRLPGSLRPLAHCLQHGAPAPGVGAGGAHQPLRTEPAPLPGDRCRRSCTGTQTWYGRWELRGG